MHIHARSKREQSEGMQSIRQPSVCVTELTEQFLRRVSSNVAASAPVSLLSVVWWQALVGQNVVKCNEKHAAVL